MSDSRDEVVDGAGAAAKILNSMPETRRKSLLGKMTAKDPSVIQRIGDKLVSFSDIAYLDAKGAQLLIKESKHETLVTALKLADESVAQTLFGNMTERKRQIVIDDLRAMPKVPRTQVEEAQKVIVQKLDELRTKGLVRLSKSDDIWV